MSEEQPRGPRKRRRRRRPGGDAAAAPRAPGGDRGPRPDGDRGPRPDGDRGARPDGGGDRRRDDGRRRSRRRRRGRDDQAPAAAPAAVPAAPAPAPALSTAFDDVDSGWDDAVDASAVSAPASAPAPTSAPIPDDLDDDAPAANEPWGDDTDAPTPDIQLSADFPADADDELDPTTAQLDELDELDDCDLPRHDARNIVGVKFTGAGKIYEFDAGDDHYRRGELVVVDGERAPRLGTVAVASVRRPHGTRELRRVLRRPSPRDLRALERNDERTADALRVARARARELRLPIKVFRADTSFGGGKITLYYSAEDKVDTRGLARDLGQQLPGRVELRQTGVRDEAKAVGGIGSCGRELCCTTFLPSFAPVSIKMAKDQNLVLNPTKVSGQCGRLKCCLVYEQATYAELRKGMPRVGKRVITDAGEGRVTEVDVLRQRIRVRLVHGDFEVFTADQVQPMFPSQNQAGHRDDHEDSV